MYFAGFGAVVKHGDELSLLQHSEAQTLLGVFLQKAEKKLTLLALFFFFFFFLFFFFSSLMAS